LIHIASHEFFHIITPLNVHSQEIHYFDFNDPDMSRHLWMYEGVTEYFSHHNQVRSGMISREEFFRRMGQKIQHSQSQYDDQLAFTELSEDCLDEHSRQYGNVYEKGALIAMCLDIELHRLSDGTYRLVDLVADLGKKFGSERPFRDGRLFREIEKLSYPEIGRFLKTHVAGNVPIPYGSFFSRIGLNYVAPRDTMVFSLGDVQLGFNQETRRLVVANTYSMNELGHTMGYRVGDEFISINGRNVPSSGLQSFIEDIRSGMVEGELLRVVVARKDESGMEQQINLEAPAFKVRRMLEPRIHANGEATPYQQALSRIWLEG
jgi:predicted metalloprotease with PDZ domain